MSKGVLKKSKLATIRCIYFFFSRYSQILWLLTFFQDSLHAFSRNLCRFFFCEECTHLFRLLVVQLDIKTNFEKMNLSGSPSSKSKQIVKFATTKNQTKCALFTEKTVKFLQKKLWRLREKKVNRQRIC